MRITIVGQVCIDHNSSEHAEYISAGSPAMFMTRVYKKFPKVQVKIISSYGRDFLRYKKDVFIYPLSPTVGKTLVYENKTRKKIRTQKSLNYERAKPVPIDENVRRIVSESDLIFLAPLTADFDEKYVAELLALTKSGCVKILEPQGYYREVDLENNIKPRDFAEAESIVPQFDFVIVSEQDHRDMKNIAKSWAKKTGVIMTQGDKGAEYFYKNESVKAKVLAVPPEQVVDSVGSGDIFGAAFGYKFRLTGEVSKSMKFANEIARQCLFYPADNLKFTLPE